MKTQRLSPEAFDLARRELLDRLNKPITPRLNFHLLLPCPRLEGEVIMYTPLVKYVSERKSGGLVWQRCNLDAG